MLINHENIDVDKYLKGENIWHQYFIENCWDFMCNAITVIERWLVKQFYEWLALS